MRERPADHIALSHPDQFVDDQPVGYLRDEFIPAQLTW